MNSLAKLGKAAQMLAEARTLDDLVAVRDRAHAASEYARAARLGAEALGHAQQIKVRAERKAGELLRTLEKSGGGRSSETAAAAAGVSDYRRAIDESGVTERDARRWQELAAAPDAKFEEAIAALDGSADGITTRRVLTKVKPWRPEAPGHPEHAAYLEEQARRRAEKLRFKAFRAREEHDREERELGFTNLKQWHRLLAPLKGVARSDVRAEDIGEDADVAIRLLEQAITKMEGLLRDLKAQARDAVDEVPVPEDAPF